MKGSKACLRAGPALLETLLDRGTRHIDDPAITKYRNRWSNAIVADQQIEAIISLGQLADTAYQQWRATPKGAGQHGDVRDGPPPDVPRVGESLRSDHQG